jgi:uncharacterized membrane protein YuzA (DUF378 family)
MGFDLMRVSLILVVLGALNCASMGLMRSDFISSALGRGSLGKAVHLVIGVAAVLIALKMFGFTEGFENNANMNGANNMNTANKMEGFNGCKDGKDKEGKECTA